MTEYISEICLLWIILCFYRFRRSEDSKSTRDATYNQNNILSISDQTQLTVKKLFQWLSSQRFGEYTELYVVVYKKIQAIQSRPELSTA